MTDAVMSISLSTIFWKSLISVYVGMGGLVCQDDASNLNHLLLCVIDMVASCGGIFSNILSSKPPQVLLLKPIILNKDCLDLTNETVR